MGQIAIGDQVRARPERQRDKERMSSQPDDARSRRIEGSVSRAAERERIGSADRQGSDQADRQHDGQDEMVLPRHPVPDRHERRSFRRHDQPRRNPTDKAE